MAQSNSASCSRGSKYALFDFQDDSSVDVGEVNWIRNFKLQASDFDEQVLADIIKNEESVQVAWPSSSASNWGRIELGKDRCRPYPCGRLSS